MREQFSRSEALLGVEGMNALRDKRVILFGVGGVGSWCAEALVRTGLGHLTIVDDDVVQASNINRQLPATCETIGRPKVEALRERLLTINPEAEIIARVERVNSEWLQANKLEGYDYIIDAIDSVADKTDLIVCASRVRGARVFSSMGAALRFDPTQVRVAEFWDVKGDALARAIRERMKRLDIRPAKKIRCVYSTEQAQRCPLRGSLMPVTATFGCTLAALVIRDLFQSTPQA